MKGNVKAEKQAQISLDCLVKNAYTYITELTRNFENASEPEMVQVKNIKGNRE